MKKWLIYYLHREPTLKNCNTKSSLFGFVNLVSSETYTDRLIINSTGTCLSGGGIGRTEASLGALIPRVIRENMWEFQIFLLLFYTPEYFLFPRGNCVDVVVKSWCVKIFREIEIRKIIRSSKISLARKLLINWCEVSWRDRGGFRKLQQWRIKIGDFCFGVENCARASSPRDVRHYRRWLRASRRERLKPVWRSAARARIRDGLSFLLF